MKSIKKNEELKAILERKNTQVDKGLKEFVEILKKDCKTFEEVKETLNRFKRDVRWEHYKEKEEDTIFLENIQKMLQKEMNDLLVPNHP
ncbi:MAG: hypothetical protein ACRC41_16110 [Sarcina sp.]